MCWEAEQNQKWENYKRINEQAKKDNSLVGRLISFQAFDGFAHYQIIAVENNIVYLNLVKVFDEYTDKVIELLNRQLPLTAVNKYFMGI